MPNGTEPDLHYTLLSVPTSSSSTLVVATSAGRATIIAGGWLPDDSQSAWIGPGLSYNGAAWQLQTPALPGNYDYRTTFNLAASGSFALSGQWSANTHGYDILWDGNSTGDSTSGSPDSSYWTPFTVSGVGVAGSNTLDFMVNANTASVYTGLRPWSSPRFPNPRPSAY